MVTSRLQQDLPCVLGLEVGVASGGVGHHPGGVCTGSKGQIRWRVGIWSVGGEVRCRGEVSHAREGRLRLVLGLAAGVRTLELVLEGVVLLAGGQIVKLLPKIKE